MNDTLRAGIICLVAALLQGSPAAAQTAPHKDLTVVSWGGSYTRSQMLAYVKPYRQQSGEWVAMETYNGGLDELREQVETENVVWDVVDFELADLIRACREGLLEKIDHASLPPGDDGTAASEDFIAGAFTDCGVGQTVWATVSASTTRPWAAARRPSWPTSSMSRSSPASAASGAIRASSWSGP